MTRIYIQGILVGPDYDIPELQAEISNGMLCPSSRILREIEGVDGDEIEININSEGGDVFAFNEVCNRIKNYPGEVRIIVGACAFSEAANLTLLSGRPVFVHPNSVMLFHSAMSSVDDAGTGELLAEAEILEKINEPVKAALVAHGVPVEEVERGFRDRNALVLGASDLARYGIATVMGEDTATAPKLNEALSIRVTALAQASRRIAAHFARRGELNIAKMDTEKETLTEEEKKKIEEELQKLAPPENLAEEKEPEETTETPAEEPAENTEETTGDSEEPESEDDEIVKVLETLQTAITDLQAKAENLEGRVKTLEDSLAEKEVELIDARKALKAERTKRIGAIAAAVSQSTVSDLPADWPAAVKLCNGDKLQAYKRFPALARAWAK